MLIDPLEWFDLLPELAQLPETELIPLIQRAEWKNKLARPNQLPPSHQDWDIWLLLAGRGFGKTRTACEWMWWEAYNDPGSFNHVVVRRSEDLQKVAFEGKSGLFRVIPQCIIADATKSPYKIVLKNGASILGFSADDPDVLRGPESHRCWCDEFAAWRRIDSAWNDGVMFGNRLKSKRNGGRPKTVVATTPRPILLLKELLDETKDPESGVFLTSGSTLENKGNLAEKAVEKLIKKFQGTRRGKQELEGQLLMDIPGALFNLDTIATCRVWDDIKSILKSMQQVVVAVDPPASSQEGSNEAGIVAAGRHENGRGYVLSDISDVMSPDEWGEAAVLLHDELLADHITVEVNQGGEMCRTVIENAAKRLYQEQKRKSKDVVVNMVRATRGKAIRAEPVSQLYAQHRVSHVGEFEELEAQMSVFTMDYDRSRNGSPDRLDAAVWALTDLLVEPEESLEGAIALGVPNSASWKKQGRTRLPSRTEYGFRE